MRFRVLSTALAGASYVALQSAAFAGQAPSGSPSPIPEQVVITASPLTGDPNGIAASVATVNRDQILQLGGANLADALRDIPGIAATQFASGASRPVIRGFDASRVRVLEDGIGTFDVSDIGPDHAVPTGPLGTDKVEVVRGPATVRYGSQAIGGVVNAINNRIPLMLPDTPFSGQVSGAYASNARAGDGSALFDARDGQFAFHADGYLRSTTNYDTPDGTQDNSWFRGDGLSGGASYFWGGSRVGAAVIHYDADYGIPSDITHIRMHQTKGIVGSSFDIGEGAFKTLTVDGGYGDYKHDEDEPDGTVDNSFIDKEWDTRAEGVFGQIGPFSSSAFGVQVQRRDFSALGVALNFLFPTVTASEAAYAFAEAPIADTLKLQLGGRVEQDNIKGTPGTLVPTKVNFTPVSGSAALVYNPTAVLTFALTAASAARAPNVVELFAHGPHDGPGTFETGNPDLTNERANSLEGRVNVHMPEGFQAEASLWGVSFTNYIHGALTGATCDEDGVCSIPGPGDYKELNYTQGGARFWGFELKAGQPVFTSDMGTLIADALGDYVRATLTSGGDVPLVEPYHVGGGLSWYSNMVDANVHVYYTGPQNHPGATLTSTDGFVSLDMGVTWRPAGLLPGLELSVTGRNLTDSRERNASALNHDVVLLPGRDVRLVASYAF